MKAITKPYKTNGVQMIKCKECSIEIDVTNADLYSEDGNTLYCPECNAPHKQQDLIQIDWATYKSPTVEEVNTVLKEHFKDMKEVVDADDNGRGDSIYGVFTEMFIQLSKRIEYLEDKVSNSTHNKQTH